jgi:hypothetical protein
LQFFLMGVLPCELAEIKITFLPSHPSLSGHFSSGHLAPDF